MASTSWGKWMVQVVDDSWPRKLSIKTKIVKTSVKTRRFSGVRSSKVRIGATASLAA